VLGGWRHSWTAKRGMLLLIKCCRTVVVLEDNDGPAVHTPCTPYAEPAMLAILS
jgi:hypothetical protein